MVDANAEFLYATDHATYAKRHYLTQFIREKTDSVVQHGILKGYEIGTSHWAEAAVGAYLLGTYEVQVCALLDRLASPDRTLVDIGAADGLYGIGLVAVGAFGRSICFEADDTSRENLGALTAKLGLEGKVEVRGKADQESIGALLSQGEGLRDGTVVLCDIEGAEFDLFTPDLLEALAECHVIIETHDFLLLEDTEAQAPLESLIGRAERVFNVHEIRDGLRDMRGIPLIADWSDADVWSMCMEGRKRMMTWLYLTPKREEKLTELEVDRIVSAYQRKLFK